MNVLRKPLFAFAVLAFIWLAPAAVRADEVIVITGGSFTVVRNAHFGSLTNNNNFALSLSEAGFAPPGCFDGGCRPGTVVSPRRTTGGLPRGSLTYNGVNYSTSPSPFLIGNGFQFFGPSFVLDPNTLVVQVPFTFTGTATVSGISPGQGQLFTFNLTGSGVATFEMFVDFSGSMNYRSVTYEFQPQATPEPATLVLFGSGAAALGAVKRRRRRAA